MKKMSRKLKPPVKVFGQNRNAEEPVLPALLLAGYRRIISELLKTLDKNGFKGLRSKHGALFANIGDKGVRPSELAKKAGITPPAMVEVIDELEEMGYIERKKDLGDRRALLIVLTKRGAKTAKLATNFFRSIEKKHETRLGKSEFLNFRKTLVLIGEYQEGEKRNTFLGNKITTAF